MATTDVHTALRDAILRGRYAPRQRLVEVDIAEDLGAGRSAVRTALLRLASDGLVEIQPNRGARVREITVAEAVEITEIRQAVEGLIAARAAERVTDEEVAELRALGTGMSQAVAAGELTTYSDLNALLHQRLREIAQHATASRILEHLGGQVVRHQFRLALLPGRPAVSLPEHLAIVEAVCAREPERARDAMTAHVGSVLATLSRLGDDV